MAEKTRETTCPGVVEYLDHTVKPTGMEVKLVPDVEPVSVVLKLHPNSIVEVQCPLLGKGMGCQRINDLPYSRDKNVLEPYCRFSYLASFRQGGSDVIPFYTQPFEDMGYYAKTWEQLSRAARTAATHFSGYAFPGMNRGAFDGMCFAFGITKNCDLVVEELAELGVVEILNKKAAHLEACEVLASRKETGDPEIDRDETVRQQVLAGLKRDLQITDQDWQRAFVEYEIKGSFPKTAAEFWSDNVLRFAPGFRQFVQQFIDPQGIPANFNRKPEEHYITKDGHVAIVNASIGQNYED